LSAQRVRALGDVAQKRQRERSRLRRFDRSDAWVGERDHGSE
jgi:hypothetical protein